MNIREGTPEDAEAMRAIYAHYVRTTAVTFEEAVPSVDDMRRRIETVLERHAFFVAEDPSAGGAAVIAYAYAAPFNARSAYRLTAESSVYVDSTRRRMGAGRALYGRLMPWLAANGFHSVMAGLNLPNPASVALHESFGFQKVGHLAEVGYKFDRWHDVGWWQKLLDA